MAPEAAGFDPLLPPKWAERMWEAIAAGPRRRVGVVRVRECWVCPDECRAANGGEKACKAPTMLRFGYAVLDADGRPLYGDSVDFVESSFLTMAEHDIRARLAAAWGLISWEPRWWLPNERDHAK